MTSYRFRRRAFITAMSGGVGLKIMLRNLEGSAQGIRSPARLLITHWPVGMVAGSSDALWKPTSGSVGGSLALKPFADAGLGPDMTVVTGVSTSFASGAEEGGMVGLVTGVAQGGSRAGRVEADDAYAGGPSFDQILLRDVAALQRPGRGYANSIADSRTDFGETSAKTLSYSPEFQDVPGGVLSGSGREAKPLEPVLSPLVQYANLFGGMLPGTPGTGGSGGGAGTGAGGGAAPPVADAMLKALVGKRSALDFAREELTQLNRLAPSGARHKLTIHTDAVLAAEASVSNAINSRYPNLGGSPMGTGGAGGMSGNGAPSCGGGCASVPAAPSSPVGMADPPTGFGNSFGNPRALQDDAPIHAAAGGAHLSVLKAAFVCDLIRVGTYQWSPAMNHVGFALVPGQTQPFQHHPRSHQINTPDTTASATLAGLNSTAQFLFNVHTWYFSRQAETFAAWKSSVDGCGNNLLDFTCVPFLTEVRACGHERSRIPAMLIGGKQLGFGHDRFVTGNFTLNQLWGTIAQAFGHSSTLAPFAPPLAGLWTKP